MNKKEIKKLLKVRESLIEIEETMTEEIEEDILDNGVIDIFKNASNNINDIVSSIDLQIKDYCETSSIGLWLLKIKGITPDVAAGLLAYFDVRNKDCAAQFIKYSGVDNHNNPHNNNVNKIVEQIGFQLLKAPDSMYASLYFDKIRELKKKDEDVSIDVVRLRAKRYMLKVFIAHLFEEMYREEHNGQLPERHAYQDSKIIEPEVPFSN